MRPRRNTIGGGRGPFRLVVFDFDGTLADTYDWFAGAINGVADRFGFRRVASEDAVRFRGLDAREIIRELGIPAWRLPLIARHMHGLAAREIAALRLFAGIPDMLAQLDRSGLELAIVSSNTETNVRAVLGPHAAHIAHFDCGASLFGKAARLRAVSTTTGFGPGAMLAIGDEIRDLDAARDVGCAFAAVGWGYTTLEALLARGPDLAFTAPDEIARVLLQDGPSAEGPQPSGPGSVPDSAAE